MMTRIAWTLFWLHVAALVFGLGGLLIALPRPELWSQHPLGPAVFAFGMQQAGVLHIVLGALAMVAVGVSVLGWRNLAIFFALSTTLSLGIELLGTGTGWPFGAYEYTAGLGEKLGGRVPFTIPLSWFSMGLAAYLLARVVVAARGWRPAAALSVGLGAWLLTVWDLVLDPAMAHESLPIRFWVWHQTGPYFGMPLQNFIGWAATGLLFMGLSRLLWRADPIPAAAPTAIAFGVFLANMLFAMVLSLSVGLWGPVLLALALGVGPAWWATRRPDPTDGRRRLAGSTR